MKEPESDARSVRILSSWHSDHCQQSGCELQDLPPRGRLYSIEPQAMGTLWQESLTSYLDRLARRHHVTPRALAIQEIAPHLSSDYQRHHLGAFSRGAATGINGNGEVAASWSSILERLTGRGDVQRLSARFWIGDLTSKRLLRTKPAWCPACYTEWSQRHLPLYQPQLWMFQVVTLCPTHLAQLVSRCPSCQKHQSVIALGTRPGHCTQCDSWLGTVPESVSDQETLHWQRWVIRSLEELRRACMSCQPLCWQPFFANLAAGVREKGVLPKLAGLTGRDLSALSDLTGHARRRYTPTLEAILDFCHLCAITPLQMMREPGALWQAIQEEQISPRQRHCRSTRSEVDRERCLQRIQAILTGQEEPIGVWPLAKQLGHYGSVLCRHFPEESKQLTQLASAYRNQRRRQHEQQVSEEVRQAVNVLHTQGVYPSVQKVANSLSKPSWMRMPAAKNALHLARRERGIEPSEQGKR